MIYSMVDNTEVQKRGKQQRGKETKQQLLQTALRLFSEKGYQQVTVDEIVKKSNSSKGSFYLHFSSKHDIFMEKFKEIDEYYIDVFKSLPEKMPIDEKLLLFIHKQMDYIQNVLGKDLMQVIYSNAIITVGDNYFTDIERPLFTILEKLLIKAHEQNEIDDSVTVKAFHFIMMKGLLGCIYHWCMASESYDLQEKSEQFFSVLIRGFINA